MDKVRIAVVFHSGYGHTRQLAEFIAHNLSSPHSVVDLTPVEETKGNMEKLHAADTIVFGCPTYFGNVSAAFKSFMEETGSFWYKQLWKDKLAAGFTNSSTSSGDKLSTLMALSVFAAQHSMLWISQGVMPRYINDQQTEGQNRLGSFLGLMTQSDNSIKEVTLIHSGDMLTAELFAKRILQTTINIKLKTNQHEKSDL